MCLVNEIIEAYVEPADREIPLNPSQSWQTESDWSHLVLSRGDLDFLGEESGVATGCELGVQCFGV